MWIILASLVVVVLAQDPVIDIDDCTEQSSGPGTTLYCPDGYAASYLCTAGRDPDCNGGTYTILRCCKVIQPADAGALMCVDYSGDYGVNVACTDQQIVTAVCTSDAGASCGNAYTRIQCCDDRDVVVGSTCYWKYSAQGVLLGCNYPGFEVIRGVCSSGRDPDCNGSDDYTGIYCCYVSA